MNTINQTTCASFAEADISPKSSQFLFGCPYVERYSTGIHDPLLSCACYVSNGDTELLFIANDMIFVPREIVCSARESLSKQTGVPADHILISATHTHSAPTTVDHASNADDATVPKADPAYLKILENGIVAARTAAYENRARAELAFARADSTGIGTKRKMPSLFPWPMESCRDTL